MRCSVSCRPRARRRRGSSPQRPSEGRGHEAHIQHDASGRTGHGGGGGVKGKPQLDNSRTDARTNNVRSTSVNNVNVNKNFNVDNHRGCCNNGWDNDYHPIASAAAVTATVAVTSAIVGSIVNAPPPDCVPVNLNPAVTQSPAGQAAALGASAVR